MKKRVNRSVVTSFYFHQSPPPPRSFFPLILSAEQKMTDEARRYKDQEKATHHDHVRRAVDRGSLREECPSNSHRHSVRLRVLLLRQLRSKFSFSRRGLFPGASDPVNCQQQFPRWLIPRDGRSCTCTMVDPARPAFLLSASQPFECRSNTR